MKVPPLAPRSRSLGQRARSITVPNSPVTCLIKEFTKNHVRLRFTEPGEPIRNPFIESLNSRLREECLNEHSPRLARHACRTIEQWRAGYNSERPHSSLGYLYIAKNLDQNRSARTYKRIPKRVSFRKNPNFADIDDARFRLLPPETEQN